MALRLRRLPLNIATPELRTIWSRRSRSPIGASCDPVDSCGLLNIASGSKISRLNKVLLFLAVFAGMRSAVQADTVVLMPAKDNTLYEDGAGSLSNGAGDYLFTGLTAAISLRRGVIAFDFAGIPPNATITGATLSMFLSKTHGGSAAISLSRTLRAWGEGASDAGEPGGAGIQAEPGDATWFHTFYDTDFWVAQGGDFSSTISATTTVNAVDTTYTWSGSGLVADVQGWVSGPASNFGWVIRGNEEIAGKAQRFNTRENTNNPPQLSVTFQAPSVTPTPTPSGTATATPVPTPTATPGGTITPTPTATPPPTPTPPTTPTATPGATPTAAPTSTPTGTPGPTPTGTPTATPMPGTFGNLSTRLRVGTGDNVLIGGFLITGTQPKRVIIRAIGPSISAFFPGTLPDPFLELRNSSGILLWSNDNWRTDQEAEILATGIPPTAELESAIVATLPAENSAYTAIVRGVNDSVGIGLVEDIDLDQAVDSRLANLATRGFVLTNNNVMIGGLIALGQSPLRVVVRAIGPSLPVPGALADPTLELYDANGTIIASNNNWRTDQELEIIATGLPPTNDLESAIVRTLAPGNYTAIVRGVDNTTGVALVEAYHLNSVGN